MRNQKLLDLVLSALLAALVCIGTTLLHIPAPMNGYIHLGDCLVLLCGWMLGPVYGALSAGLGSAFADLLSGAPHYIPATFCIKALMAPLAQVLYRFLTPLFRSSRRPALLCSALVAEGLMVLGYFLWAALLFGEGLAAAASIPGNLIQGLGGVVFGVLLMETLHRTRLMDKLEEKQ